VLDGRLRLRRRETERRLVTGVTNGPIPAQPVLEHLEQHVNATVDVVEDPDLGLARVKSVEAAGVLCTSVPLKETGSARNRVSRRASSKPSPMYHAVASRGVVPPATSTPGES
jgi:hypothetical protein